MSVEKQQELIRLIQLMADRAQVCVNPTDRDLMLQALVYLADYQSLVSRRSE